MLKLSLAAGEYLTINGNIVVQVYRAENGRSYLAIDAPRTVPIVRGAVLERDGGQRPACLAPPARTKARYHRDQIFRWNDDRERAVRVMKRVIDRLEENGAGDEAGILRTQLDRLIPAFWEEDLAAP